MGGTPERLGRMWWKGGGAEVEEGMGPVSLRGSWGRGGVPMLESDPPTIRGSTGTGRDPREIGGSEENMASVSSDHLVPGEPAEILGRILHPLRLPPQCLSCAECTVLPAGARPTAHDVNQTRTRYQ